MSMVTASAHHVAVEQIQVTDTLSGTYYNRALRHFCSGAQYVSFDVLVVLFSKSRRFLKEGFTFDGDASLKSSSPKYRGRSEISSRLPQGFENNLHVLVSAK